MNNMLAWTVGIGLLTVVFLIRRWNKHRKKPRQIAKRKLKALSASLSNEQRNDFAIQLISILQQGLEIPRLENYKPNDTEQWKVFIKELETASYSSKQPSSSDLKNLLEQSSFWLRQT